MYIYDDNVNEDGEVVDGSYDDAEIFLILLALVGLNSSVRMYVTDRKISLNLEGPSMSSN